jgi:hypothetical protein
MSADMKFHFRSAAKVCSVVMMMLPGPGQLDTPHGARVPSPALPTPCKSVFPANREIYREGSRFFGLFAAQPSLIWRQIQKLALIFPR